VPAALRAAVLATMGETGEGVPALDQLVLTELLTRGDYDRQVRRVRLAYRRRRDELAERRASLTPVPLDGVPAGLHALFPVESAAQERKLVAGAAHTGLQLHGLHAYGYWHTEGDHQPAALVLGYATPPRHDWRRCLAALAALITAEDERTYPADPANPSRQDRQAGVHPSSWRE
jgi:GntR family transcriptional regulator / MocR family aminotransferase